MDFQILELITESFLSFLIIHQLLQQGLLYLNDVMP